MEELTIRPPNQRTNCIKSAVHIMEHSKAEPLEKITAVINCLFPEDAEAIQKAITQTLNSLNQKG